MSFVLSEIMPKYYRSRAFTLVELISIIVIMSIMATLGSQFVIVMIDGYSQAQTRNVLVGRGKLAVEQLSRQLRAAAPNSIRVSVSGNCIEYLPIVAGANYLNELPDATNFAAETSSISTASFSLGLGTGQYILVGASDSSEIYILGSPSSRASVDLVGTGPFTSVTLVSDHRFFRNSISKRFFITDSPRRFCLIGEDLYAYDNYGLITTALNDLNPGGDTSLIAVGVSTPSVAFALSDQTQTRSTAIDIALTFLKNNTSVSFEQRVLLRNVP